MSLSQKKRKTIDFTEEGDDVCALESGNQDERVGEKEMHLRNMEKLIEGLRKEGSVEKSESLMKELLIEAKELCETNAFDKSLEAIYNDVVVSFDDDDSSEDENPIESIANERDRKWEIMFQQLRDYRILNGDCKVVQKYTENPQLGGWLSNQKTHYKNIQTGKGMKLKPERIIKLESLGICWGGKYPPPPSWSDMFEKLLQFRKQMGSYNVPFNSSNPTALAKWISYQRTEYKRFKNGRDSLLTLDQIGKLKEIGFNWRGPKL